MSALNWRFQTLARSCTSRGKHTPAENWFRQWKKAAWLRRLSTRMCPPSEADHGVALWMASLAESRASHTVSPENASEKMMSGTCGPTRVELSCSPESGGVLSKTSPACCLPGAQSASGETFTAWISRLREDSSRRRKLAPAMNASASSSSRWRTPTDDSARGGPQSALKPLQGGHTINLQDQVQDFGLESAWPTPAARDYKGANGADHLENGTGRLHLDQLPNFVAHIWMTPRVSRGMYTRDQGQKGAERLTFEGQASLWSTPRASDGEKGGPNQAFGAGGTPLPAQAVQAHQNWASPRVSDTKGADTARQNNNSGKRHQGDGLATMAVSLPPAQETQVSGGASLPTGQTSAPRSLNPIFVSWLMGWDVPELTNSGFLEMGSYRYRQLMRSELLRLGLPPEAPSVQPDLFG